MEHNMQPNISEHIVNYRKQKDERLAYLKKKYVKRPNNPWYMLTSGKCYNYEERKMSWGVKVDVFRVKSETATLEVVKTKRKRLYHTEMMEGLVQHKMKKWDIRNPRPCDDRDIFADHFLPPYFEMREKAVERTRDMVVATYHKLTIYGRYKKANGTYTDGYPIEIAKIPDRTTDLVGKKITEIPTTSKILKRATKIVTMESQRDSNFIGGLIRGHTDKCARLVLPQMVA